ncbi:zinc metalloprotease [Nocardia sp. IFM 10818]
MTQHSGPPAEHGSPSDPLALQRGPVSGRYEGFGTELGTRTSLLDLRIDIDTRYSGDSPVMNRVSGDFFQLLGGSPPPAPPAQPIYIESWIVDNPAVTWSADRVVVSGAVRYWRRSPNPAVQVRITVPWSGAAIGPAMVEFSTGGTTTAAYLCNYRSDDFRTMVLELDYASSVNIAPHAPVYDTHSHPNRPGGTRRRTLTLETAYREAGVGLTVDPVRTVIDDSATGFASWSPAELHDAMETAFSRINGAWPAWSMWGLQAGTFDRPTVGGIMFDADAGFGGAGRSPERQGFAVFRKHTWFDDLAPGPPQTLAQARAMRHFLYTWVHEAGHAFNFLHSWDKARPNSLSWMNYDWRYDMINGQDKFWADFRFRFDDEELVHLRHGDLASVMMGGDPWASGGHLESPALRATRLGPDQSLELLLRAPSYFSYMEPVEIEFRLRNLLPVPQSVDVRLSPDHGTTTVLVRKPNGTMVQFNSVMCLYGLPETRVLAPAADGAQGPDRYSELVPLTFGKRGFVFDEPGQYELRAVYSSGNQYAVSNTLGVRIGQPATKEQDRFAAEFFDRQVGLALTFGGSMSPYLATGMRTLTEAADRFADDDLGAKVATTVAKSVGRDFFGRTITDGEDKMVQRHKADPAAALAVTEPGLQRYRKSDDRSANLTYNELVTLRANLHIANGDPELARQELVALAEDLGARGVNPNVLQDIRAKAKSVPGKRRGGK